MGVFVGAAAVFEALLAWGFAGDADEVAPDAAAFLTGCFAGVPPVAGLEGVLVADLAGVLVAAGDFVGVALDGVEAFFVSLSTMLIFCMPAILSISFRRDWRDT